MNKELNIGEEVLIFRYIPEWGINQDFENYVIGKIVKSEMSADLSYHGSPWCIMNYTVLGEDSKEYFGNYYATNKTTIDNKTGETITTKVKWVQPDIDDITQQTPSDEEIDLPERVLYILPILASHYVWLDDDQTKAMIYWNEYDDFRTRLEEEARSRNYNCEFYGGLWF